MTECRHKQHDNPLPWLCDHGIDAFSIAVRKTEGPKLQSLNGLLRYWLVKEGPQNVIDQGRLTHFVNNVSQFL